MTSPARAIVHRTRGRTMAGDVRYEDTTGKKGVLPAGGVEWMRAGNGVWHTGAPPSDVPQAGPARVLLGRHGGAHSPIPAPAGMNYLAVRLKDGERWRYTPPAGHTVAWLAVSAGQLEANETVGAGELAVFEESGEPIDLVADGDTSFVMGSAVKHSHDLVTGYYSVHTSKATLAQGEAEIQRIGTQLRREGRLG